MMQLLMVKCLVELAILNQVICITLNDQKECPVCGKVYDSSHNFCSDHKELIELVFTKDLVKVCPKCGIKYKKEANFCSKHSELVRLIYIDELVKICGKCGEKYPAAYDYCRKCNSPLRYIVDTPKIKEIETHPNSYYNFKDYSNRFGEVSDLLSDKNIEKLDSFRLDESQFDDIISNIKKTYRLILDNLIEDYQIDFEALSTVDKILLFSKSFVKTEYKEGGRDLGNFEFNEIYIDDRAPNALQITTIIHELSHFILAEILEQIVSIVLNTDKTDAVEAFVCYTLVRDSFNYLMDEYCAHTVEGRYALYGYQDYGSYTNHLKEFLKINEEDLVPVANGIGNTFAKYIKDIMASFISEELREDIKNEYNNINDLPKYSHLQYETNEIYEWERFSKALQLILTKKLDDILGNNQDFEHLEQYAVKFKMNNG